MTRTILVNKDNKFKEHFLTRIDLIETENVYNVMVLVEKETFDSFNGLRDYLKDLNIDIYINKGYIDNDYYDEHCTGLVIDFVLKIDGNVIDNLDICMDSLKIIHNNLYKYGFILRYPTGKEESTGKSYNPFCIRYVGDFVSRIIFHNNFSLEEYVNDFRGVLFINKEKGVTSFDVVHEISKLFGIKKVGHTGTLDPLATGVMLVTIGKATKIVELLTSTYKEYVAKVRLGILTDTLDVTGKIVASNDKFEVNNLLDVINSFKGTYMQEVPIYSAVKINGEKLYNYARCNKKIDLPKRSVTIKEIELLDQDSDTFTFRSVVSKGCYIRSLIRDIGDKLGIYASMEELNRTMQGGISIKDTYTVDSIRNGNYKIYDIDDVLDYRVVVVNDFLANMIRHGQKLNDTWEITDKVIFRDSNNILLGIYEKCDDKLVVWKNF